MKRNLETIKKESKIFGLLFLGDDSKILRCLLLNIMDSGKNIPVAVLEIAYCQGNLGDEKKKHGIFICNQFFKHMK